MIRINCKSPSLCKLREFDHNKSTAVIYISKIFYPVYQFIHNFHVITSPPITRLEPKMKIF